MAGMFSDFVPTLPLETAEQKAARIAEVKDLAQRIYAVTVASLGEEAGRRFWAEIAKKKPGAPRGARNPSRDQRLLAIYDAMAAERPDQPASLPREVAEFVCSKAPQTFGRNVASRERRMRALLHKRKEEAAAVRKLLEHPLLTGAPLGLGLPSQSKGFFDPELPATDQKEG